VKIAIATIGRFWVLDLARELSAHNHEVTFWSAVPRRTTRSFGLPRSGHRSLLPRLLPTLAVRRFVPGAADEANRKLIVSADHSIASRLDPCDVFIGMSGVAVESARVARSFKEQGFPSEKLFRNPYGVDLSEFPPTSAPTGMPTILFVGAWSYRKGVDVLVEAWRQLGHVRLLHVGAVVDAPLPSDDNFTHVDAVPQSRLRDYYAKAHVFAMASREEGLALVQAQALASGLPLVCTDRTGGEDLQQLLGDQTVVKVVATDDAEALASGIRAMLVRNRDLKGERRLPESDREHLGWAAYGARYAQELTRTVGEGRG
jgi:glycosyltransferase involved in cell wall biosynthesis